MEIISYIQNWTQNRFIERYELKEKVLTINDLNSNIKLANGVAFFYSIYAAGQIQSVNNLQGEFLTAETTTDYYMLKNMIEIKDFGTFQSVKCNFLFTAENSVKFNLNVGQANSLFTTITNLHINYLYLTELANE